MIKKYKMFIKYIIVAIISFGVDITFFNLFLKLIKSIILATILARIISSLVNYLLNKNKVFDNKAKHKSTIIKYYLLVIFSMLLSAFTVNGLSHIIKINPTFIKIPVECLIFVFNYIVQKLIIFKNNT